MISPVWSANVARSPMCHFPEFVQILASVDGKMFGTFFSSRYSMIALVVGVPRCRIMTNTLSRSTRRLAFVTALGGRWKRGGGGGKSVVRGVVGAGAGVA